MGASNGKIYNLRTIKLDWASNGKSLVIWYGCHQTQNFFEFHVDRNLKVSYTGMDLNKADADVVIAEISKLLRGNCFNAKASVMLVGNCFVPQLPSLPQIKSEIAPVEAAAVVAPVTEAAANAELVEADTDSMPPKS